MTYLIIKGKFTPFYNEVGQTNATVIVIIKVCVVNVFGCTNIETLHILQGVQKKLSIFDYGKAAQNKIG